MEKMNRNDILAKYPWLKPYPNNPEYLDPDTALMVDSIPKGWKTFIWEMVEAINNCLIENNCVEEYKLFQVKEKFGSLRWYDNLTCTSDIIKKYEDISWNTCVVCGDVATYYSTNWICPYCKNCVDDFIKKRPIAKMGIDFKRKS